MATAPILETTPTPSTTLHAGDLAAALLDRCRRLPTTPMVGGQERLRWLTLDGAAFAARTEALAAALQARGVAEGDRVVVWTPNGWRTPILFAAIWRLGAIVVPYDREMNTDAARTILRLVRPALVITGYGQRPAWAPEEGIVEWWDPTPDRCASLMPLPAPDPERVAAIYYTSGTTGAPKGCTITHGNLLSQLEAMPQIVPIAPGDVFGSILPLSHLFELTCGMLYPLVAGATVVYMPSLKGPDIVRVMAEQHVSHMIVVPRVLASMGAAAEKRLQEQLGERRYHQLLALADRLPMAARRLLFRPVHQRLGGRLKMLASGGAALDPELQRFWERLGVRTLQGYGASECSPIIACGRPDGSTPYGSVGTPLPNVEIRIDETGQLLARGPNVMRGYWEDPARTASVITPDGFYATGDLVEVDARGNITIRGRAQDLLVLPSGMNVWPSDVEEQLRRSAAVKDAVVILVPTGPAKARLHAYLLPSGAPDPALLPGIVAAANGHLAAHQRVATASWWLDEDFPRTSTLKIKRRLLPMPDEMPGPAAAQPAAQQIDPTAAADDPVGQALRAATGTAEWREAQTLSELGVDSLMSVGLAVEIESRTGLSVPDGTIDPAMTVAALRRALSALATGVEAAPAPAAPASEAQVKRAEEAGTWLPPLWVYTRGRFLRRLRTPLDLLHRRAVPRVITLGGEHLAVLDQGAILAGTHHSYADVPSIQRAIAETASRRLADRLVIAASSVIVGRAGWLGKLVTVGFGLFPLRQYGGQDESLRRLAQIADAGNSILIFPQGHHADPAAEQRGDPDAAFKPGIAHLAIDLALPVVPFGLAGTEGVVAPRVPDNFKGRVIAGIPVQYHRRNVAVAFGAPLVPATGETVTAFTLRLQEACFALARQAEAALQKPVQH
jgi:long-chain acyl-CoA synthetase